MPRTTVGPSSPIPVHTIDLAKPPRERYLGLAKQYTTQLRSLTSLFDEFIEVNVPYFPKWLVRTFARLTLRSVHSREETDELRGICEITKIPIYLLVSFNVFLDLMMGCTSGGVRVREGRKGGSGQGGTGCVRMLHFRNLDWDMDPLRDIIVQLDFVDTSSSTPKKVIATSITYVGFVGVLTGVRDGLSISLNFRPLHDAETRKKNRAYYWNHVLVLFSYRQGIASALRSFLLPRTSPPASPAAALPTIDQILQEYPSQKSTAAYVTFCTGKETHVLSKDNGSAARRSSESFIAVTNHDISPENDKVEQINGKGCKEVGIVLTDEHEQVGNGKLSGHGEELSIIKSRPESRFDLLHMSLTEVLDESKDRLSCLTQRWEKLKAEAPEHQRGDLSITHSELQRWFQAYPTTNECTHFGCIMDPAGGKVTWARKYDVDAEPVCQASPNPTVVVR